MRRHDTLTVNWFSVSFYRPTKNGYSGIWQFNCTIHWRVRMICADEMQRVYISDTLIQKDLTKTNRRRTEKNTLIFSFRFLTPLGSSPHLAVLVRIYNGRGKVWKWYWPNIILSKIMGLNSGNTSINENQFSLYRLPCQRSREVHRSARARVVLFAIRRPYKKSIFK